MPTQKGALWAKLNEMQANGIQLLLLMAVLALVLLGFALPSWAGLEDDRYDGNIFALYGSNGGMIPPRVTLEASLARGVPAILVYYIDDSSDCKQYAAAIANLQVRYGIGVNFLVYAIDGLDLNDPKGPGRYYKGKVPQTVLFDPKGQIAYQSEGNRSITEVENAIRSLFDLSPVAVGQFLPQPFNEVQTGYGTSLTPRRKGGTTSQG